MSEHNCADVRWLTCGHETHDPGEVMRPHIQITCLGRYTGLRFPELSTKCEWPGMRHDDCSDCQGRGRSPIDTLEEWLDATESLGFTLWTIRSWPSGQYHVGVREPGNQGKNHEVIASTVPTRMEAVQQVMCKIMGTHPDGPI